MPNTAEQQNGVPADSPRLRRHGSDPIRHSPEFGIVAECMPPNFLANANSSCNHADSIPHQRLAPIRLSALAVWAGEDPVGCSLVSRVGPPSAECSREKRIERNWFLRRFGLA